MGDKKSAEKGATEAGVVKFWAPENEKLIIGGSPVINFTGHRLMVKTPKIIERLEKGSGYGKLYYKVIDKPSSGDDRVRLMKYLTKLLGDDRSDQVKEERGIMAAFALFEDNELAEINISKSFTDKEKLMLAVLDTKTIEGI